MSAFPDQLGSQRAYWDAAAETYERDFTNTLVGKLWRDAVWRELDRGFRAEQRVVELNCGTGIDAIYLAERGVRVVACDVSPRMIQFARERASAAHVLDRVDFRVLPTEWIEQLQSEAPFDGVLSNFSGLNCVRDLFAVKRKLVALLRSHSNVFLCVLGCFSPWRFLHRCSYCRSRKKLFRNGTLDSSTPVEIQRPPVKHIINLFAPEFAIRRITGIGITVPPSYLNHWASRVPSLSRALGMVDGIIGRWPLVRHMGSCILLQFERTALRKN
jgi:SAM-dependent methyltransferase